LTRLSSKPRHTDETSCPKGTGQLARLEELKGGEHKNVCFDAAKVAKVRKLITGNTSKEIRIAPPRD
jgi:hypothetical protein